MTTIIDDLDTPCPHHCSDTIGQCLNISKDTPSPYCIYNKDCIYKQYARKEQECEELKEEFKLFQQLKDEDSFRVVELSTENVKLKHQLDLYKNSHKTEQNRRRVFEQTLAEIKEICNKTVCDYLQCSLNYNHSKDFECEKTSCNRAKRRKFILEILQKINEVENDKRTNTQDIL